MQLLNNRSRGTKMQIRGGLPAAGINLFGDDVIEEEYGDQ